MIKIKIISIILLYIVTAGCRFEGQDVSYELQVETDPSVLYDKKDKVDEPMEHIEESVLPPVQSSVEISALPVHTEKVYDVDLDGDVQQYLIEICDEYKMEPSLVLAIIEVESGFRPDVISKTNDYGLMQINKCNHAAYKELLGITDFLDPKQNILAGVHMLATLRDSYGCDTVHKMLMAYNLGIGKARKYWEQGVESNSYSRKILDLQSKF